MQYQELNQRFNRESNTQTIQQSYNSKKGLYGFKANAFPLFSSTLATFTLISSYYVARDKNPPDIAAFPNVDITHIAIRYPQYVIYRIGLMVVPVLFCITFQSLKNYLTVKSFEIIGQSDSRVNKLGYLSILSCILLCLSTCTISDARDMNWQLHNIGTWGFYIITLYMISISSKIYRQLYMIKKFCPQISYKVKKYSNIILIILISLKVLEYLNIFSYGYIFQWGIMFYIIYFVFTLSYDFKDLDMMLIRIK